MTRGSPPARIARRNQGFTLIEILATLILLGLTTAWIAQIAVAFTRTSNNLAAMNDAATTAQSLLALELYHPEDYDTAKARLLSQAGDRGWTVSLTALPCNLNPALTELQIRIEGAGLRKPLILTRWIRYEI